MSTEPNENVQLTDEDREFAAITDEEIWKEAKDRMQTATEAYSENRKRARAAMLFREGDQWDHDVITTASEDNPELTINLTDAFVRRVVNNIKQQRPRGKAHPVGDNADIEIAEVINGIGRHVEVRSEASVAYDLAAEQAVVCGEGYFRMIAEYVSPDSFQKDLRIIPIRNIFSVYMDPSAIMPSGQDQKWCLITVKMKRQEYKRLYPDAKNVNFVDLDRDRSRLEWEDKEEIRLAEYFRIREVKEKLYLINGMNGEEFTLYHSELPRNLENKIVLEDAKERLAERGFRIVSERESVKKRVEWFRLNGLMVVERQIIPGQYIPVFRVDGNVVDVDGRIRRRGMVETMMDAQRMVNYGEVAKIKRLGLAPKAPWIAAEGQLDGHPEWDDANIKPYSVLTYKPVIIETSAGPIPMPPPQRQSPAQIEAGFSDFVDSMKSNLLAVSGMPNEPGQDADGIVVSGMAIKRRQWLSDQSHYQYYDNLTQAIAQCWRTMVEWIPVYFSESRMQRVIGEDSTPQMVQLNKREIDQETGITRVKNDLSVGRYDVVMDTGPGYDTKREEGAETLLSMLQSPALAEIVSKVAPDLVFRSIDHPYMQELADRLMANTPDGLQKVLEGLSSRAQSLVRSLFSENQQLQQQLQQLQLELKTGMAKTQLQEETKRVDVLTRAHTALAVEELKAGASMMNTHLEQKYHKEAAQEMARNALNVERLNEAPNPLNQQPNQQQ